MHAAIATLLLVVGQACETCGTGGCASGACAGDGLTWEQRWFCGPMPQTCYEPRYGCYPGNARTNHRYPAFHGSYYRSPYNWRNAFDYPWHAEPHEPTSLFSYQTEEVVEEVETPVPGTIRDDLRTLDPPPAPPNEHGHDTFPQLNRLPKPNPRHAKRGSNARTAQVARPATSSANVKRAPDGARQITIQ
ncbi:MAG: hypothetical protein KF708_22865 [Pirellulales bacterium]|nr:hypothetical protein [Pirellulales bacterium]